MTHLIHFLEATTAFAIALCWILFWAHRAVDAKTVTIAFYYMGAALLPIVLIVFWAVTE